MIAACLACPTTSFQVPIGGMLLKERATTSIATPSSLCCSRLQRASSNIASTLSMVAASESETSTEEKEKAMKATDYFKPLVDGDILESTDEQRTIVGVAYVLLGALATKGVLLLPPASPLTALGVATSIVIGYEFADMGSGVYHWAMDNYGTKDTPVFGTQIEAFQGHHELPWTITYRQFSNNIYKICQATSPFCLAGLLLVDNPYLLLWMTTAIAFINMSQELHKWSHQGPAQSTAWVNTLQELNLIITRKSHLAHHRPPFDGNYCIVSGHMNPILDQIGFFRTLENIVFRTTGNRARCWTNERLLADKVEAIGIKRKTATDRDAASD
eukprot:CAMPEP_0196721388 /NCGR_PEP_ID=MMETSP1091-20130531/3960_1 /TAXON_ID=302021 /ORGANISM="Rhodomonas sp., Strain CCMP768" /LENGTH=329 /DNA_ID=CAMNT_0042062845 /DNA_START=69 /DNA_END=1058 /DNA_ORIENTATION=+